MFVFKRLVKRKIKAFDDENTTPSDFTLFVKGLPHDYKASELKIFFEQKGLNNQKIEVACISQVYNIEYYVQQVRKLEKLKGTLAYVEDYIKLYNKHPSTPCCAKYNYSRNQLNLQINSITR